ncbi:MAG: SIS domain-containing protein [Chlorobi bacterium CHB1]|nr:SIS domain-containing protein [Chlorobi bacterium CHB1]
MSVISRMKSDKAEILAIGHKLVNVLRGGGKIFFCGNGGSAADAQHLAAELVCKLRDDRPPLAGLALTTDTSTLTATSNDYSFRDVFARQVIALGASGDALVGISSSGNSAVGLLGRDGGAIAGAVDQSVIVPDHDTQRIQECHILVGHIWMEMIEHELFG